MPLTDEAGVALVILSTVLVNNVVMTQFLGLCPFMGASRRMDAAVGLGLATALVLTLACTVAWLLDRFVLVPLDAAYLRTIAFIFAIASAVQAVETSLRAWAPALHRVLGIYLPLITTNCAVLGMALISVEQATTLGGAALRGVGAAAGFTLVMVMFTGLRERIVGEHVPALMRGAPVALVTAALLSLAFMGFIGMDRTP